MGDSVNIAEEAERHKDEWLLFEVTELDEIDQPVKGRLLFHGETSEEAYRESMKFPDTDICVFFSGPAVPPDMVLVPTFITI